MCNQILQPDYLTSLDTIFKFATISIAIFNVYFAVKVFRIKDKKDDTEKERDRKIQLFKTLVLDFNLKHCYSFFDDIFKNLISLKSTNLNDNDKKLISRDLDGFFILLRVNFIDLLLAIDKTLHTKIENEADDLQKQLTDTIFDQGVNLSHLPKYDELINQKIANTKAEIIKILFEFRG